MISLTLPAATSVSWTICNSLPLWSRQRFNHPGGLIQYSKDARGVPTQTRWPLQFSQLDDERLGIVANRVSRFAAVLRLFIQGGLAVEEGLRALGGLNGQFRVRREGSQGLPRHGE